MDFNQFQIHEDILYEGEYYWNAWRESYPDIMPILTDIDLSYADLSEYNLKNADLTNSTIIKSDLFLVDLSSAILLNACISDSYLHSTDMSHSTCTGLDFSFSKIFRSDFSHCDLSESNFRNTLLFRSSFEHCDLSGADFSGSYISGADFSCAELKNVNFEGATLLQVNFTGAYFDDNLLQHLTNKEKQKIFSSDHRPIKLSKTAIYILRDKKKRDKMKGLFESLIERESAKNYE